MTKKIKVKKLSMSMLLSSLDIFINFKKYMNFAYIIIYASLHVLLCFVQLDKLQSPQKQLP